MLLAFIFFRHLGSISLNSKDFFLFLSPFVCPHFFLSTVLIFLKCFCKKVVKNYLSVNIIFYGKHLSSLYQNLRKPTTVVYPMSIIVSYISLDQNADRHTKHQDAQCVGHSKYTIIVPCLYIIVIHKITSLLIFFYLTY